MLKVNIENVYNVCTLSDEDVENVTTKYLQTVKTIKTAITNHKNFTKINVGDETLIIANSDFDNDFDVKNDIDFSYNYKLFFPEEVGVHYMLIDEPEMLYRWICQVVNGEYDFDDYDEI